MEVPRCRLRKHLRIIYRDRMGRLGEAPPPNHAASPSPVKGRTATHSSSPSSLSPPSPLAPSRVNINTTTRSVPHNICLPE
ncbi:hypothetical protein E2C01_060504 [Portunus trituberculatus]|uniref:Uncharacterized protein n=1 Tax=Portunus trituberculatus TaxID=210409 RepID=A0A5B7HAN8_PORTR|nr:hypothetical protein [Portunus trituberculatus]